MGDGTSYETTFAQLNTFFYLCYMFSHELKFSKEGFIFYVRWRQYQRVVFYME